MKCPKCSEELNQLKKYCPNCGYLFTFDEKWKQIQQHESLEMKVLIKCIVIAVVIAFAFSFLGA